MEFLRCHDELWLAPKRNLFDPVSALKPPTREWASQSVECLTQMTRGAGRECVLGRGSKPNRCRRRTAKPDLASLPVEVAELQPRRGWHTPHILQPCHVPQRILSLGASRLFHNHLLSERGKGSPPFARRAPRLVERTDFPVARLFASEPFCTVLPKQMSDPINVSREQLPAKPDGLPS